MPTNVSVIGMGKMGAPTVAAMAARRIRAIGVDSDAARVEPIERGMPPVFERSLTETLIRAQGRLTATQSIEVSVRDSDITFIVVAASADTHGTFSLRYLLPACARAQSWNPGIESCPRIGPRGPQEPRQRGNRQTRGEHLRHYEDQLREHFGPFV